MPLYFVCHFDDISCKGWDIVSKLVIPLLAGEMVSVISRLRLLLSLFYPSPLSMISIKHPNVDCKTLKIIAIEQYQSHSSQDITTARVSEDGFKDTK